MRIGDCMGVSPWVVVWTRVVWIRHRFMVVRGFCFVKFGAPGVSVSDGGGEIPAFAGMTWVGAGMAWECGGVA